ncbi:DUF5107 domain-containing protein [Arthrobacter sp. NPDC090010]|uniref:DUF5107 domain-containing protein n=1 Tax=Arthrobacter sp. NPDC090010 TaxID=3363942 RepID=UPI00380425D2
MPGITVSSIPLDVSALPGGNTFPLLGPLPDTPYDPGVEGSAGLGDLGYGYPPSLFPYSVQDGYARELTRQEVTAVVLENSRLRAVVLPQWGGRLWELQDKATGKQLLHTPDTLQLANFALRNAWFAGGIEWNLGTRGHAPTSCEPLHCGLVRGSDGQEVLRLWEYERLRGLVFQVDLWLPEDSPVLLASVRIRNVQDHEVPVYWWTNAAVPQDEHSRVLAPAVQAYSNDYHRIAVVDPTRYEGRDCTWPARNTHAADFFFDLPEDGPRWLLNADVDGDGLAMLSTQRLRGRKLFVWGRGQGGRRWQHWLTPRGGEYAEIQAGLAQTQFQHLPMPAGAEWSWTEAYGNAAVSPAAAHSEDWSHAMTEGQRRADALLGPEGLEAAHRAATSRMDLAPEPLSAGSGWGALERAARISEGRAAEFPGTPFDESTLGPAQEPWLRLLRDGSFSGATAAVSGGRWEELLARLPGNADAMLHRAFMSHGSGRVEEAELLYRRTLALRDTAEAHRGLGSLLKTHGDPSEALEHYRSACALASGDRRLLIEAAEAMLDAGAATDALDLLDAADGNASVKDDVEGSFEGRLSLLRARTLYALGRNEDVAALLESGIEVPDLREGATVLRDLWDAAFPRIPLPERYDFTMS